MRSKPPGLLASAAAAAAAVFTATPALASVQHASLGGGREGIYITGEILEPDQAAFAALAAAHPRAVVYLESPGGSLLPAIEIGKLVRAKRYTTVVMDQGTCYSACALIWVAGSTRHLGETGRIGFHASYSEERGRLVETGVGNAIVGHYLSQLGFPEKTVIFATSASPRELMWLTAANSAEAGISYQASLAGVPAPNRTLLIDPYVLRKSKEAETAAPGKGAEPADPNKDQPRQIEPLPGEQTKADLKAA